MAVRHFSARVLVSDDGAGIDPDTMAEVFRSPIGTIPGAAPTRMGLRLARSVASAMGGDLTYRRTAGRSVFELTLPLVAADTRSRNSGIDPTTGG